LLSPATTGFAIGPTTKPERIVALDALRGFALLGILLVNILSFSGISALGGEFVGADRIVHGFIKFFVQGKFLSLFAILFGVSFSMQLTRLQEKGMGVFPIYWRRLATLWVLGMLHTLLDPAEVLAVYAICGAALILFREAPRPAVLLAAIVLMGLPYLHTAIVTPVYRAEATAQTAPDESVETDSSVSGKESEDLAQSGESANNEAEGDEDAFYSWDPYLGPRAIDVYSNGTFGDVVTYNRQFTANRWSGSWVSYMWMTVPLPLMLLGMLIGRSGIMTCVGQQKSLLKKVFWCGLGSGIILGALVIFLFALAGKSGWNPWIAFPASWLFALSGLVMAVAYAAGLLLLLQKRLGAGLQTALGSVGRMALTNYLLQTVICISLFYGFGMGLYGKLGVSQAALVALGIFALQIVFSRLWLSVFQFGPVEWMWRMATYWRVMSIRVAADP
jgi:uncharacterized protein